VKVSASESQCQRSNASSSLSSHYIRQSIRKERGLMSDSPC